jgi:hypothetical protein
MVFDEVISSHCAILGIIVSGPYKFSFGGKDIEFSAYLPEFGGNSGILVQELIAPDFNVSEFHIKAAENQGIAISFLNIQSIICIDDFVETLNDWGFYGHESKDFSAAIRHRGKSGDVTKQA